MTNTETANTETRKAVETLPLPPRNPLPFRQTVKALHNFQTGPEVLREAGGPVVRIKLAPPWVVPEIVITTSPQGAHDVLGTSDAIVERNVVHHEMRSLIGVNLFDLPHDEWLPRRRLLQPLFTKKRVRDFGGPMAEAADSISEGWASSSEVDLDVQCRRLTLRALGRSVLGLDGACTGRRHRPRDRSRAER
jgi:cytochrome P450